MYFDVNGKQTFASSGGEAFDSNKPVVMFLHGSGLDHSFWTHYCRFFAVKNYAVLAPDLPGHSHSEGPALTSIEEIGDWLNELAVALDIDNISIVAHSQGCLNALEYVSRYPDRVRSVSLIASGLATPVNPALIDAAEHRPEAAIAMMTTWGFGPVGDLQQESNPGDSAMAGIRRALQKNVPDALTTDLKTCNDYKNGKAAAAAINCPVQCLIAEKDRMAPIKATREMLEYLNEPEVHYFPDTGHMIPLEAHDRCRHLLKTFIFANNPVA